jgi:adenylate cyclase
LRTYGRLTKTLGTGLIVGLLFSLLFAARVFEPLELKALDFRFHSYAKRMIPSDDIIILTIDQNSIDYLKNRLDIVWKWPRDVYAHTIRYLSMSGAKSIIMDMDFSDPDINRAEHEEGETDYLLGQAIKDAGNVINATLFYRNPSTSRFHIDSADYDMLKRFSVRVKGKGTMELPDNSYAVAPIPAIMEHGSGVGATNLSMDMDGVIRRLDLFQKLKDDIYPSSALSLVLSVTGSEQVKISPDRIMRLGGNDFELNIAGQVYINWYGPGGPEGDIYKYIPIADVLLSYMRVGEGMEPLIPQEVFRDRIVLVGSNAPSLYDLKPTPMSFAGPYPGVEIIATAVNNLLDGNSLVRAGAGNIVLLIFACCLLSASIVSYVRSVPANIILALMLVAGVWYLSVYALFNNVFLDVVPVLAGVFISYMAVTVTNYLTEGREKRWLKKAFSQYISPSVMDELIQNPEKLKLGGEKRNLTILFSDIRSFTLISEMLEPEQITSILNEYLTPMTEIVYRYGGTLDKYIGDAVMAIYGAPVELDDNAGAACNSSLDMMEELSNLKQMWKESGLPDFVYNMNIGIGLNSGPVSVGNMGSESKFDYTVIGDNVNLSSRLEGSTKFYGTSILVSENTYLITKDDFIYREIDLIRVVGKNIPVRIYELIKRKTGGEEESGILEHIDRFHEGLRLYRDRKWEEAARMFGSVDLRGRPDKACGIYIERCEDFKLMPPPEDWDGAYERREK